MVKWIGASIFILVCAAAPAEAAEPRQYAIPAMPLDQALVRLGEQAGISVGGGDPRMRTAISRAVRGRMTLVQALRRMLSGTGFGYVFVDARTVRIVAVPIPAPKPPKPPKPAKAVKPIPKPRPPAPEKASPATSDPPPVEIIVTANKQNQPLSDYAGTVRVADIGAIGLSAEAGTSALVARIPELNSTNLGPGRNKIFIRGIADSSFNGPTQSTVGLYLGDLRLTYNAPEPDLRYYDVARVEILEGPQGTLYGAGALGGIIRIVPNAPDSDRFHARASGGYAMSSNGNDSHDVGGMLNIPLVPGNLAARIVGYKQIEGGYIDNVGLNQRDTNRTRVEGARATLEATPGNGWRIALSGVLQNIDTRDGQYAERGLAPLTHNATVAQPHDNDFRGGDFVIAKSWKNVEFLSSTGIIRHNLSERFDASSVSVGTVYDREEHIKMVVHETRLSSRGHGRSSWVAGISYVSNIDSMEQFLGEPTSPNSISAVRNEKEEIALFGEATLPLTDRLTVTAGSRLLRSKTAGEVIGTEIEPTRASWRVLPTFGFAWKPSDHFQTFARFHSGYRSGGVAVEPSGNIDRFSSDKIYTGEIGARFGDAQSSISGSVGASFAKWNDIQADLLNATGFPTTLNIGNGHVAGFQAELAWRPASSILIESAIFANRSGLDSPAIDLAGLRDVPLPNIPRYGARISGRWTYELSPAMRLQTDATLRYRSGSNVGTLPPLVLEQGEYVEADLGAVLDAGKWKLSLDMTNVFNAKENSFSFGNPFTASLGRDITPLRPRTVRIGVSLGF